MEYIFIICICVITMIILKFAWSIKIKDIKKLKELGYDKSLNEITNKLPENKEICKNILKILNNENVKIEEDKNSNATLYLVMSNKIFIANLRESYTRIQTIAHECLHSIQSKKLLWFNFIFSNIYLAYFFIICILAIFKILPYKMMFLSILTILGLVFYAVREYLENDAMIKAKFLAKEYMQEQGISSQEEINKIVRKYDELNDIGIKCTNFQLFSNVILKLLILLIICVIR